MADENGKAVEIEWLKRSLERIESCVVKMDEKFEKWTTVQCPVRHKETEDRVQKVDDRLRALELKVYGMAATITIISNILFQLGKKYLGG